MRKHVLEIFSECCLPCGRPVSDSEDGAGSGWRGWQYWRGGNLCGNLWPWWQCQCQCTDPAWEASRGGTQDHTTTRLSLGLEYHHHWHLKEGGEGQGAEDVNTKNKLYSKNNLVYLSSIFLILKLV